MEIKVCSLGGNQTNTYIITNGSNQCLIIDPATSEIEKIIQKEQLVPTHILLTHGHFDHIGGVQILKEKYNTTVIAGHDEIELLSDPQLNLSIMIGNKMQVVCDKVLANNEIFHWNNLTITSIKTPGHTIGSVVYIIENSIFSGDTLFYESCGRTDLPTGDANMLKTSLSFLINNYPNHLVYPGHGSATSINHEKENNPYI